MELVRLALVAGALLSAAVAADAAPAAQPVRPSARLLHELARSDDLKAFTTSALTRPAEGGYFYARYVANMCGRDWAVITRYGQAAVEPEIRASGPLPAWRVEMMQNLPRRCAGFAPGEAGAILADLKSRPDLLEDPLLSAERELVDASRAGRHAALRSAVRRLIQLDDPVLWTERRLWDRVAQSDPRTRGRGGYFFDRKVYQGDDPKFLEIALALEIGFCQPDLPCAPDDELSVVCATGGDCAPDRYAKSRSFYLANGGSEKGWPRVLALVRRIQNALRTGDVAMFVR